MKLEELTEDDLLRNMRPIKDRGILNGYLFGEPYLKEGNLYIKRDIVTQASVWADLTTEYGYGHFLNPEEFVSAQAKHIGLKPLTSKVVCLDLMQVLTNLGLKERFISDINSDKPEFSSGLIEEQSRDMAFSQSTREGTLLGYWVGNTLIKYQKSVCKIISQCDNHPILQLEHALNSDTKDVGVLLKAQDISGIESARFLRAYKRNIEVACVRSYEEELKKQKEKPIRESR